MRLAEEQFAGPLVVGAVMFDKPIPDLIDSKRIARQHRPRFAQRIMEEAYDWGIGWVWPEEIDKIGNLTRATGLAINRALSDMKKKPEHDFLLIDGNTNFLTGNAKVILKVKAEDSFPVVAAASIIAKVARDNYMVEQSEVHNLYGFEDNVGYGTASHMQAIYDAGRVCELHRKSFKPIKEYLDSVKEELPEAA